MNKLLTGTFLLLLCVSVSGFHSWSHKRVNLDLLLSSHKSNFVKIKVVSGSTLSSACPENYISYTFKGEYLLKQVSAPPVDKRNICLQRFLKVGAEYLVVQQEFELLESQDKVDTFTLFSEIVNNNHIILDKHFVSFDTIETGKITVDECVDDACNSDDRFSALALSELLEILKANKSPALID